MRMQLLSTLVWMFPPSFCPWTLGGDVSVAALVWIFSCRLLRSSAIRFNTNSRSWQTDTHKTRCSVLFWDYISDTCSVIMKETARPAELALFSTRSYSFQHCWPVSFVFSLLWPPEQHVVSAALRSHSCPVLCGTRPVVGLGTGCMTVMVSAPMKGTLLE